MKVLRTASSAAVLCLALGALAARPARSQENGAAPKAAADKSAGNADRGKKLFVDDGCYECHGRAAQGGVGPRLAPKPPTANVIAAYIRQPSGEMPPYTAKVISDAEIADIYAYLQTIPEPPKVDSIPLLK